MAIEGIAVSDFQHLQVLKQQAQVDEKKALPEASRQFEAVFLQAMLKSMRMGQHFLDDSSPFNNKTQATFQDMLDGQYASNIAHGQGIGLADMLAKQLSQNDNVQARGVDQSLFPTRVAPKEISLESTKIDSAGIDNFVKSVWPYAQQAASLLGLDPKLLMAQAALETGWGQFVTKDAEGNSSNNFFNIKAATNTSQDAVRIQTTEYLADTPIKINASFRKYPTVEHGFNDYVALIKGSNRYETALANTNNPERYVDELHRAGYATDPAYASKVLAIYHGDELQQALNRNGFL
ncbi:MULTISPECIES: glucosaminidase domain-containing protein [unclassified Legionella]|uniref:glucosaminidase domain-containing protein n=1 Tax=unclassified Legionella TaxID=2622702 RepID=UPI00105599B7|nr:MULTISPECIES: glucosaminidase domain-containing protein [unclassified Legionella]MDI9819488.1 glucosaminidase domain-containing protein [Legionella sp. PL877]